MPSGEPSEAKAQPEADPPPAEISLGLDAAARLTVVERTAKRLSTFWPSIEQYMDTYDRMPPPLHAHLSVYVVCWLK
jgi:hypothetical protein